MPAELGADYRMNPVGGGVICGVMLCRGVASVADTPWRDVVSLWCTRAALYCSVSNCSIGGGGGIGLSLFFCYTGQEQVHR